MGRNVRVTVELNVRVKGYDALLEGCRYGMETLMVILDRKMTLSTNKRLDVEIC